MKVFAHRGVSATYPENTIIAFEQAAALNIWGVEFDVHVTKDHELVVIHDESIDRTSNGTGFVKDMTLAQLRQFDYGSWFAPQFAGQQIPTLKEVLSLFKHTHHMINLEMKTDIFEYAYIEQFIADIIEEMQLHDRLIVSSFNHESLLRFQNICPTVQTALLFESLIVDLEDYLKKLACNAIHIAYYHSQRHIVQQTIQHGITVRAYTVNDVATATALQQAGIQAIFSDNPQLFTK